MSDQPDRTEPHSVDLPATSLNARRVEKPRVWHLFVLFLVAQGAILFTVVAIGFVAAARWHAGPSGPRRRMLSMIAFGGASRTSALQLQLTRATELFGAIAFRFRSVEKRTLWPR